MKCQVLWVFVSFRSFLLLYDLMWMLCLVVCFIFSLLPPSVCENVTGEVCVGENTESMLKFASELRGLCGECLSSSHWKFVFEVVSNAFSMFCESKGSLK